MPHRFHATVARQSTNILFVVSCALFGCSSVGWRHRAEGCDALRVHRCGLEIRRKGLWSASCRKGGDHPGHHLRLNTQNKAGHRRSHPRCINWILAYSDFSVPDTFPPPLLLPETLNSFDNCLMLAHLDGCVSASGHFMRLSVEFGRCPVVIVFSSLLGWQPGQSWTSPFSCMASVAIL